MGFSSMDFALMHFSSMGFGGFRGALKPMKLKRQTAKHYKIKDSAAA
jgi:hypothetical protein